MTLLAIRPDADTGELVEDAEVVDRLPNGWDFLKQSISLWGLAGGGRGDQIEAIRKRALGRAGEAEVRLEAPEIHQLIHLLDGIDAALVSMKAVDRHWRADPDFLEDLAEIVPAMDLKTERSVDDKTHALAEVMINALSLRKFLINAEAAGCVVVLG